MIATPTFKIELVQQKLYKIAVLPLFKVDPALCRDGTDAVKPACFCKEFMIVKGNRYLCAKQAEGCGFTIDIIALQFMMANNYFKTSPKPDKPGEYAYNSVHYIPYCESCRTMKLTCPNTATWLSYRIPTYICDCKNYIGCDFEEKLKENYNMDAIKAMNPAYFSRTSKKTATTGGLPPAKRFQPVIDFCE
jgi:hypothetical protein